MKIPILHQIESYFRTQKRLICPKPTQISIDISNFCNAACPFCQRQISTKKLTGFMSKEIFYDILEQVKQIKSIKNFVLACYGEPLMHPDFDEFVDILKSNGYGVSFPTNFSLAHKHFNSLLKVDNIMISIEGHDKENYERLRKNLNFETTLNNLKEFDKLIKERREKGLPTPSREINFIINKKSKIKEFIECYQDYTDLIVVRPMVELFEWDDKTQNIKTLKNESFHKDLFELTHKLKKNPCTMPSYNIFVRPDGKLFLCCSDYDIGLDFGDYKNLLNNWRKNKNLNKIRKALINNKESICSNCFSNYDLPKSEMYKTFPELEEIEKNNNKIEVHTLR